MAKKVVVKVWWKSKTMVANALALLGGVFLAINADMTAGIAVTAWSVINVALRVATKQAVKW